MWTHWYRDVLPLLLLICIQLISSSAPTSLPDDRALWHTRHQFLRHQRAAASASAPSASSASASAAQSSMPRSRPTCLEVMDECTQRFGCEPAMNNVRRICGIPLFFESASAEAEAEAEARGRRSANASRAAQQCLEGPLCVQTLAALVSSRDGVGDRPNDGVGRQFVSCDCQGNAHCEEQKRRMLPCRPRMQPLKTRYLRALKSSSAATTARRPAHRVSCSLAGFMCQSDGICVYKLSEMLRHCNTSLTHQNVPVSERCTNAVRTLRDERRGRPLFTCVCERRTPPVVPFDYPCADFVTTLKRANAAAFAARPAAAPVAAQSAAVASDPETANRVARAAAAAAASNTTPAGVAAPLSGQSGNTTQSDPTQHSQRPPPP